MADLRVLGVDPGPVPGFVLLTFERGRLVQSDVVQCSRWVAVGLFGHLVAASDVQTLVQIERYVVGRRSGRSSTAAAGQDTRDLVGVLVEAFGAHSRNAQLHERPAGAVKPWATDARLAAAGLDHLTKGMRHARDAARHALFCAVADGGVPDPLSKEFQR